MTYLDKITQRPTQNLFADNMRILIGGVKEPVAVPPAPLARNSDYRFGLFLAEATHAAQDSHRLCPLIRSLADPLTR